MSKITYLLGAGASIEALPLAADLADRLSQFSTEVLKPAVTRAYGTDGMSYANAYLLPPDGTFGKELVESLEWLAGSTRHHASVDTYAKKLFIRGGDEAKESLHRLKVTLSSYLLLEQSLKPIDKRYDSFLASILTPGDDGVPRWPDAVNIVTWNYDTQLEKSYKEFCPDPSLVYKGITSSQNIFRLNGVCGVPDRDEHRDLYHLEFSRSFFERVLALFDAQMKRSQVFEPSISFAWEKTEGVPRAVTEAVRDTTTLVIIGYSFPYFNKSVDEVWLSTMTASKLGKIFIQAPEQDQRAVQDRLLTLFGDYQTKHRIRERIEPINIGPFYIPDDMPR